MRVRSETSINKHVLHFYVDIIFSFRANSLSFSEAVITFDLRKKDTFLLSKQKKSVKAKGIHTPKNTPTERHFPPR